MLKISQNAISTLCYFTKRRTSSRKIGIDTYIKKRDHPFLPKIIAHRKNGSGCVLSSAIVSNLALGNDLRTACYLAKDYIKPIYNRTQLN
jgi:hydroxymethylpyrimidine/phosphomethylpyrimidine kinase